MIGDDQFLRSVGWDEPTLERHAVERRKRDLLVNQILLRRRMHNRRTKLPRERVGYRVKYLIDLLLGRRRRMSKGGFGHKFSFHANLRYATTRGFNSSSHHWRKLVGVVDCGVRGSAVSSPWL